MILFQAMNSSEHGGISDEAMLEKGKMTFVMFYNSTDQIINKNVSELYFVTHKTHSSINTHQILIKTVEVWL